MNIKLLLKRLGRRLNRLDNLMDRLWASYQELMDAYKIEDKKGKR